MKHLLLTTIAAVVLVGCGSSVDIHQAAKDGNIEAVKQHLDAGADVNAMNKYGWTPLFYAVQVDYKEVAELLITKGADVNAKDVKGKTPLHYPSTKGIAELLIAKGADLNAKDEWGCTPSHYYAASGHKGITEILIANGANVNAKDKDGDTPLDYYVESKAVAKIDDLLRKHGGKTGEELKAEGK